jgi:hypothetical protein
MNAKWLSLYLAGKLHSNNVPAKTPSHCGDAISKQRLERASHGK